MVKILRCPECGANEDDLHVELDAVVVYRAFVNLKAPDELSLEEDNIIRSEGYRIVCNLCLAESEGHDWLEGWLVEKGLGDR